MKYQIRQANFPRDREVVVGLWRGNLGSPTRLEWKFTWFYEASPTGWPLTLLLQCQGPGDTGESNEAVGAATAGRRSMFLDGQVVEAGLLVDLAVDPAHRTLYPALTLQKAMRRTGLLGFHFLYGFPNQKAAAVFARAGYTAVGSMVRYVRVLRHAPYLARQGIPRAAARLLGIVVDSGIRLVEALRQLGSARPELLPATFEDPVLEEILGRDGWKDAVHGARSGEFLRWRFAADEGHRYELLLSRERSASQFAGFWVLEQQGEVLCVCDCSPGLLIDKGISMHWRGLFDWARGRGATSVSFACLAPPGVVRALLDIGMTPRGSRPVFAAFPEAEPDSGKPGAWLLTSADEDE